MKSLVLAALVAAGVICSASSADAQFRYRNRGITYSYPVYSSYSYSYPTYSYSYPSYSYSYPSYYSSGVSSSYYYPSSSYYSSYPSTWSSYYGSPYGGWANQYYGNYGNPYYGSGYYNRGININPSGIYWGGRQIFDW